MHGDGLGISAQHKFVIFTRKKHAIALLEGHADAIRRKIRSIHRQLPARQYGKTHLTARGIQNGEISDSSKSERDVKLAMLERSAHSFFLADSSKQGLVFPYRIADLTELDGMIDES